MTVQELPEELEAVQRDRMDTEVAPPETLGAMAAVAEVSRKLVDDTDLGPKDGPASG